MVSVLLAQAPEGGDSPGAVLARVQARWTREALDGETTLLAYDRGVAVLVEREAQLKAAVLTRQRRARELEAASRALATVPLGELTGAGQVSQLARLEEAERAAIRERSELRADCLRALLTLAELRGRVEAKRDTLGAARAVCGADAGVSPSLCGSVVTGEAVFGELLVAVTREQGRVEALCGSE